MKTNMELEFKSIITKEQYEALIKEFDLENNIYAQTNYYFDTPDYKLKQMHTVLRIRQKGSNYKLTKKEHGVHENEASESHIFLQEKQALKLLHEGFNALILDLPYDVENVCELTTYRCKTPYKDGTLFFDRSVYYGNVDYEVEYEVSDIKQGLKDFKEFLQLNNIEYKEPIRKSNRAYSCIMNKA